MFLGYYKMRGINSITGFFVKMKHRFRGNVIQKNVTISKDAVLHGGIYIGESSNILSDTELGKNARIGNCTYLTRVKVGDNSTIEGFSLIQGKSDIKVIIGNNSYISSHSTIEASAEVIIGNHVSVGPNLRIVTHTGHLQALTDEKIGSPKHLVKKPVIIEDNVYIGVGTTILMGVTIGKYSVVNAGSVVTKSVPPYSFIQGIPAKATGKVTFQNGEPVIIKK